MVDFDILTANVSCTIINSRFIGSPPKTVELATTCEFRNQQGEIIFAISAKDGIIFPNMSAKDGAFYLAKVLLDPDFQEIRIRADRVFFAGIAAVQKDDSGKYVMEWLGSEPPEHFLELQKEFSRIMDLWVFA